MITVNKCGYGSRHTSAFNNLNPRGNEDYLLLLIKTEGFFEKDGIYMQLSPNTGILYGKHSHIHYGSRNTDYSDDWIRFDLSGDDILLLSELSLPLRLPFPCLFLELCQTISVLRQWRQCPVHRFDIRSWTALCALCSFPLHLRYVQFHMSITVANTIRL